MSLNLKHGFTGKVFANMVSGEAVSPKSGYTAKYFNAFKKDKDLKKYVQKI